MAKDCIGGAPKWVNYGEPMVLARILRIGRFTKSMD